MAALSRSPTIIPAAMPQVTTALIVANIAIYFLQQVVPPSLEALFALWPLGTAQASGGQASFQPWQMVTYGFLHADLFHLGFNMYGVYLFGSALELVVGPRRYLSYYFVCVIAAAVVQLIFARLSGGFYPTVGASGGVFGLLLAYAVYFPHNKLMLLFLPVPIPARVFVMIYAALELFLGVTGTQSGVAHFAHLGGLVGGAAMLFYWGKFRRR